MFCPLSAVCLAEKQQTPILQSFIWPEQDLNLWKEQSMNITDKF